MAAKAEATRLILASGSATRRSMLASAGLAFEVIPADVDEHQIRAQFMGENPHWTPEGLAARLACAKAQAVSALYPDALVIGADQTLAAENGLIHKSADLAEAHETLMRLRGKSHALHSAVALARRGTADWHGVASARMRMRNFSPEFLRTYLDQAGKECLSSVGVYLVEGLGVQLFEDIEGDHFTIRGLPLLALLKELRSRGVMAA